MKEKHVIEIPDNVETAFVIMRQNDGKNLPALVKGHPRAEEALSLLFGIFVGALQHVESQDAVGRNFGRTFREIIRNSKLEDIRDDLSKIAMAFSKKTRE